mgnify:FL=1
MNYAEFEAMLAEDLPHLSTRIRNMIQYGMHKGYDYVPTVGDIIAMSDKEILKTPNLGKKSVRELRLIIEQQATQHGICISEFKGVQRRLSIALIEGLELVGEQRMVEELLKAIKRAKKAVETKQALREVIESISPSETPFMSVRSNVELNQYEWRTTL